MMTASTYREGDRYTFDGDRPELVSEVDLAFPAKVDHLMPTPELLAKCAEDADLSEWAVLRNTWIFSGLDAKSSFVPKEGVDPEMAMRHIHCCLGTYSTPHEDKEAGVAALMSIFFTGAKFKAPDKEEWKIIGDHP